MHPSLYPSQEDQVLLQVKNRPGISELVGKLRKKIDPFCTPLSRTLIYLSTLFDEGLQYRTANAHRSAISAYHNFINGEPICKHSKICALLTGIFTTTVQFHLGC